MKSYSEPAVLALKEAVRRETSVEILMEEAPVGDHQANGVAENSVKNLQGQLRVLKDALESRIKKRVDGEHLTVPWMVMHAATVINKGRKDDEAFMPHRRREGKEFNRPVADIEKCVMYLPAVSAGENKFDVRWMGGMCLGVKLESG